MANETAQQNVDTITVAEAAKRLDESRFVIAEDNFKTPSMGDYYIDGVDTAYLDKIHENITNEKNGAKKAAFYIEPPPVTKPGYYPDKGVYCLKAKVDITPEDIKLGKIDGDTIHVLLDSIDNGEDERVTEHINQAVSTSIKELTRIAGSLNDKTFAPIEFTVRLIAIDAPEIPHWAKERNIVISEYETKKIKIGLAKTLPEHIYVKGTNRTDEENVSFIKIGTTGKWFEYQHISETNPDGKCDIMWLTADESTPNTYSQGIKARDAVVDILRKANNEVHLILDATILSNNYQQFPRRYGSTMFDSSFLNTIKQFADNILDPIDYRFAGFNLLGQDVYRRFLGACYVQIDGHWINLAKRLIVDFDQIEVNKNFKNMPIYESHYSMASNVFDLPSHEYNDKLWADVLWDVSKQFDDRRKVQQKIFGKTFDGLKQWTVVIGDTTFFIPPTSIRCVTQSTSERVPLLRAKGSMAKSGEKSEKLLELSLYFNEEHGINGYEYKTITPNETPITYHINGLRALIAQFKFTPFLPIDNEYINDVLNIEAVTLVNMQVQTVPGFPKLLQAVIVLQEFMYRVYMPEIPIQDTDDEEYQNYFASCINFESMRYYYQQPIIRGEKLAAQNAPFNSKEYIEATLGNRTALLPMRFKNSDIKFYIANETHLKKLLQTKIDALRRPAATIVLSENEKQAGADMSFIYKKITQMLNDIQFEVPFKELNTLPQDQIIGSTEIKKSLPYIETAKNEPVDTKLDYIRILGNEKYVSLASKELKQKLNTLLQRMRAYMNSINAEAQKTIIRSIDFVYKEEDISDSIINSSKFKLSVGISVEVELNYLTDDTQFEDMKRAASLLIDEPVNKFFIDRKLVIPLAIELEKVQILYVDNEFDIDVNHTLYIDSKNKKFYFDTNAPDVKFLGYCDTLAKSKEDPNSENIIRKQTIDIEKLDTIIFDPYNIDDVRIANMAVTFGNTFAKIGVSSMDGYAPQYMGGQDSEINIEFHTTSQETVAMLNALPRLAAFYAREYRLVLPCWPLKLESELTAFFGINEVLIESVTVNTVPNMPGVYSVLMKLVSVDRTLRNRETLKRIEASNQGYQGIAARTLTNTKSYFELQNILARVELYPDLELPTIEELKCHGFQFIRYKFQHNRIYPDPDFYFVYAHILSSQIIRETILGSIEENFDDITWLDGTGAAMKTKVAETKGITPYSFNEKAEKQRKAIRAANEEKAKQMAETAIPDNVKATDFDLLNILNASETTESWDVCKDIKCLFLEKKYQIELKTYKNFLRYQTTIKNVKQAANIETKSPDGKWVYDSTAKAREVSGLIENYLTSTKIDEKVQVYQRESSYDFATATDIKNTVKKYLEDKNIGAIMSGLNINNSTRFKEVVAEIIYVAACAATGQKEYVNKMLDNSWKPKPDFIGIRIGGTQDKGGKDITYDVNDAVETAIEFGPFRTKMYTKEELVKITGEEIKSKSVDSPDTINARRYLMDPYYRYAEPNIVAEYKKGCIGNVKYAAAAFFRLMLYWLKYLIDTDAIPTISTDILRKAAMNELDIAQTTKKIIENAYSAVKADSPGIGPLLPESIMTQYESGSIENHIDFFLKNSHALDSGKFFAATVLAITSGDNIIKGRIKNRDYRGLNGYLQSCSMPSVNIDPSDSTSLYVRKMLLGLVGVGMIKNFGAIGINQINPAAEFIQDVNEKIYLKAAEDPKQYIMHSFYDMTVNDCRGRMLRAFPAFYFLFIDEGREIGMWKLHDNFYNISSIAEIQVTKSRKIAADTARIVMSNMYKTFTINDEDINMSYNIDGDDIWDSLFNSRIYAIKEELKRTKAPPVNRVWLNPGTRIHVRMGYGSNAATLPIVFNGCIAEVRAGEAVEIIAQGDGIELMNPIFDDEAHEIQFKDNIGGLLTNGATPKTILNSILTTKGSIIANLLKDTEYAHLLERSPYGLYHFGDMDNKSIFRGGEPIQNIYEAMSRPAWGEEGSITEQYATDEAPRITFDVFGKTIWDIMHICQSVSPDFCVGVAPFGFRSTMFHGAPRYYYAYDYIQKNEVLLEKRKPYQQYHIYSSLTDIVKNNIMASDKDVKTCAIGLYQMAEFMNYKSQNRIGPLYVDIEIYPENQKTMIVDTQLYGKGIPILGCINPFSSVINWLTNTLADDKGSLTSHEKIAWRMTANALKNSVADMYQGDLIVLGDSTVKPHDRMFLNDMYENIGGQCLVKEVVHNFSAFSGFTTSVYPDAIATVDDRHELAIQTVGNALSAVYSVVVSSLIWAPSMAFGGPAATLSKSLNTITSRAAGMFNTGVGVAEHAGVTGAIAKMRDALNAVRKIIPFGRGAAGAAGVVAGTAGAAAGTTGAIATAVSLLSNPIIICMTIVIGKYVTESIARRAKNWQVLQVFPLKKHGLALTAGLAGNRGLVYGSPSYNNTGMIKGLYSKLTNGSFNNWTDHILSFAQEVLMSDEMKNVGAKYLRDNNIINDKGNPVADERMFEKALKTTAGSQGEIISSYRALQLIPRIALNNKKQIKESFDYYAINDIERIQVNPKLKNSQLISADLRLKPYLEEKFFQIVHEQDNLNVGKNVKNLVLMIDGKNINTKAIVNKNSDGTELYDLPLLNKEAITILYEIVKRTKDKMPAKNVIDQYQSFEETKGCYVILKSALRAGDKGMKLKGAIGATGFSFVLQGTDKAAIALLSAVKEFETEVSENAKANNLLNPIVFVSNSLENNEIGITVLLPDMSATQLSEEST